MNRIPKGESLMKSTKINKRIAPKKSAVKHLLNPIIAAVARGSSFIRGSSVRCKERRIRRWVYKIMKENS